MEDSKTVESRLSCEMDMLKAWVGREAYEIITDENKTGWDGTLELPRSKWTISLTREETDQ